MGEINNRIILSESEKDNWISILFEYYSTKGFSENEANSKIEAVLQESQIGWKNAPKNIDDRIKLKSGFQAKSHENLKPNFKINVPVEEPEAEDPDQSEAFSFLTKKERIKLDRRMEHYCKEFAFNNTSDEPLLKQLIIEEIIQDRLLADKLKKLNRDNGNELSSCLTRIKTIQDLLGITRAKRDSERNKIDGNIADISMTLSDKLKKMPQELADQYKQELYYDAIKKQRPPYNIVPSIDKLGQILNIEGKQASLNEKNLGELTEAIHDIQEEQKVAEAKRELNSKPSNALPSGTLVE